jgi:hypothetical protein
VGEAKLKSDDTNFIKRRKEPDDLKNWYDGKYGPHTGVCRLQEVCNSGGVCSMNEY